MEYIEKRGLGLEAKRNQDRKEEPPHHIRIFGHSDSTPEKPMWLLEHHLSETGDKKPQSFTFDDGHEMLAHVAQHAHVPTEES